LRQARACLSEQTLLVRADMRQMPFLDCFTVVVNFFTSFGYFVKEEENLAVLEGVSRALKAGGRLFIDYVNAEYVEQTLQPESVRTVDGIEILETRWIDHRARRVNKSTRLRQAGKTLKRLSESVRLYRSGEFEDLLATQGLVVDRMFGDYSGVPLTPAFPRMIIVGHKAG
jgi:SAM-dependent methyltransferase